VIIRHSALGNEEQWFDPRFNIIEETDLFLRIAYKWKLGMVSEPLAKWRIHASSLTQTKNYLVFQENMLMLDKFKTILPDFSQRFSEEIGIFMAQSSISKAKNLWKTGNSQASRSCLAPYVFKNNKAFILYFLTFFPERLLSPLLAKTLKRVVPA
jgi:hypothetical protein